MGKLIEEYNTEFDYLEEFDMLVNSSYRTLILLVYKEADARGYTTTSLAELLKISKYEIHNWIRDPEAITIKDLIKLELILDISILNIVSSNEEISRV